MKRYLLSISIIALMTICLNGQQFYPLDQPVLPPSPSSSSVMKFAAVPAGLSNGIIPVNIPLLTLPGRALSASVGLSYHASGVKVAETPGPVGSNWGFINGGLITRTMYSRPDEMNEGYLKWKQLAGDDWSFESDTIENFAKGTWDSQADVFHYMFPGHSGKFVFGLDSNGSDSIYTIPHSLLEIDWNDTDTIINEFTITTEGGVRYYFGKSLTGNREAIETARCDAFFTGGSSFNYNSAWYLLQVVSPTIKDTIDYYYSRCNEYIDYKYGEAHYSPIWSYPEDASISSQSEDYSATISYSIPILDSIVAASGRINCYHSGNRLDLPAAKKIDSLALFNYLGDRIKSVDFDYTHFSCGSDSLERRLVLTNLTEIGSDGSEMPEYTFSYQNGDSLPSRDSDKLDYWGYYNNNNKSYLYTEYWGLDGADRNSDTARVKYGTLTKIEYPAGGYKEFQYEANFISKKRNYSVSSDQYIYDEVSVDWENIDARTPDTIKFYIDFSQDVWIEYELDGINPKFVGHIYIYRDDNLTWSKSIDQAFESGTDNPTFSEGEHTIVLVSMDDSQTASISVTYKRYRDFMVPYATNDAYVGGTRIKKVIVHDDISTANNVQTSYFYNDTISSEVSSGVLTDFLPNFHYEYRHDHNDSTTIYFARYSRLNNLLFDGGYHLGYSSYQTSVGDETGQIMVRTVSPSDEINESSDEFPYAYPTSAGWKRGQVSSSYSYDSDDYLRTESYNTYAVYDEEGQANYHEIIGLKASTHSTQNECSTEDIKHISSWSHPVYQKNISHSVDGWSSVTSDQTFYFDNTDHMKMTMKTSALGGQDILETRIKYPLDYAEGTNDSKSTALSFMRDNLNLQGAPIEVYSYIGDSIVSARVNTYKVVNSVLYPDTTFTYDLANPVYKSNFDSTKVDQSGSFVLDANYRPLNAIDEIDSYNRIQEAHAIHGNSTVTLYGYNALYPIATFINASSDEVAYSSFECEQKGNFIYNDDNLTKDTCAITGDYILSTGSISKSNLPSGNYLLTFWAKSAPSISVTNGSYTLVDNTSVNRQGMRYFNYSITANGSTSISLSSISGIDEIRLFPKFSVVATITYTPLVGVTSQAGLNSIPSYTSYDAFGRSKKLMDQDKYIIQEYEYNNANQ